MTELKTRTDLELFAANLREKMYELPENILLLVILERDIFNSLHMEITMEYADTDRMIYMTNAGIELGIKIKAT
jgi:hypothetical protein